MKHSTKMTDLDGNIVVQTLQMYNGVNLVRH